VLLRGGADVRKKLTWVLLFLVILSVVGCNSGQSKAEILEKMLDTISSITSYQLEGEIEQGGQIFQLRQWFVGPDSLRTAMYQPSQLEQIVVSSGGDASAYYSATKQWIKVGEPNQGPFPFGLPLLMLLGEMSKENTAVTDTFNSIKLNIPAQKGWDTCEVVVSKRTGLPESCTLVKGNESVTLRVTSLVLNPRLSDELFQMGQ